ncbi:MAG: DUF421 domain-containing protein [Candidatus Xenobia bacterium]
MELAVEIFLRTAIIFVAVVGGTRLIGKRHMGQMNVYDLAMVMAVSNAVQNAMTRGEGHLTIGLVAAGTLMLAGWTAARLLRTAPRLASRVLGSPVLLAYDGVLRPDVMQREELTEEDVMRAVREAGVAAIQDTAMIVLEVDGSLSVVPRSEH